MSIGTAAILIQAIALIKCEILTNKYYFNFEYAHLNNTMLGEQAYFKVLDCDGSVASVYYVSKDNAGAHVLTFEKTNDTWTETDWKTVWSKKGSASEVI